MVSRRDEVEPGARSGNATGEHHIASQTPASALEIGLPIGIAVFGDCKCRAMTRAVHLDNRHGRFDVKIDGEFSGRSGVHAFAARRRERINVSRSIALEIKLLVIS